MRKKAVEINMPMLAVRGLVVFPGAVVHFDVSRKRSETALKAAINDGSKLIFLTAQKDDLVENPEIDDLYRVGTVAEIRQILKTPDGITRVLVEGKYRAKLMSIDEVEPYFISTVKQLPNCIISKDDEVEIEAVVRAIKVSFEHYCQYMPRMPKELVHAVLAEKDPEKFFDVIAHNIALPVEDKQDLLEEDYLISRLGMLLAMISRETEILDIENSIQGKVQERINDGQRAYYLREQMKVISEQLGEDDSERDEIEDYADRIEELGLEHDTEMKLMREVDRLNKMPLSSQEAFVIRNYLDTVLDLPWNKQTKDKTDVKKARAQLDKDHYGMDKVKDRIIENIAVRALQPELKGQILCLVGPPGVGKTSIGKSIAKTLGRNYARVSLGGIRDESDIRGHRKTYVGAMPGRIINAVKNAGSNNPLILLDEIDKMSNDMRGDPSSALLEVLDSEQNSAFRDHYIEVPFDLSNVLFVTTANTTQTIDAPLLDRMEVIELTSYTREEKFHIAKEHLIPKQLKKNGLKASMLKIADSAVYSIIDSYTREAGVRSLERFIASLCRKAAKEIVADEVKKVSVTARNIEKYLGSKKYLDDDLAKKNEVGIVNGLAWTSVGGVIMPLEAVVLDGKGSIETTGSLGDVMKESAKLAVSYARMVANEYGISPDFYKEKDIHIHAPEGATPKDGPSAGVTMTTALISALSGIPVRCDIAMTGEITLHGKVLPIGGLREKTMAAYKAGMKTVIIPKGNKGDLEEVDDVVKNGIEFVFAETLSDVLNVALAGKPKPTSKQKNEKLIIHQAVNGDEPKPEKSISS
ncbi:MAG: endopeptidase La [Oscillospiraceae bacterium]|nr:endopeptidase La [Oscillospiraceae bacterium]